MANTLEMEVKERFQNDIKNHVMTIKHNDGIFREIDFRVPGSSNLYFRLVTWNWHLCVNGDMGTYVFCRTEDMFKFFRQESGELKTNPSYWAEKVVSSDKCSVKKFSGEKTAENLKEQLNDFIESHELNEQQATDLRDSFEYSIVDVIGDDEHGMIQAARDFEWDDGKKSHSVFYDAWEYSTKEYTYHFLWNLYAIVWGIQQYDAARKAVAP